MEKNKAFLLMMARKKEELKKTEEGTSSHKVATMKVTSSQTVNSTLKVSTEQQPSSTAPIVIPT